MASLLPSSPFIDSDPTAFDVSDRTNEYRQTVLRLAHKYSSSKIAWDVSQDVLDKLWDTSAVAPHDGRRAQAGSGAKLDTVIAYICQGCGARLHPGWRGTTLRVQRPGKSPTVSSKKTAKRRALRKRHKAALAAERDRSHQHHQNNRRNLPSVDTPAAAAAPKTKLVILKDDPSALGPLDRNRLVLTCGRCRHKTYLKGLRRDLPTQPPQPKATPKVMAGVVPTTPTTNGGVANLSENFERLPELSNQKHKDKPRQPPHATKNLPAKKPPSTSMTLLEQKLARKKRKKKTPAKSGGNLMNFLSSLNDH